MYSLRLCALVSAAVAAFSLPLASSAQAPQLINYQGRLVNGTNLVNGSVGLSLRLFDASTGGMKLYEDSNTVTVVDGLYATFLGDNTTSGVLAEALTNATVFVEVAVNGVALTPRERMASVPFALNVNATGIAGAIGDAHLSTNVALLNVPDTSVQALGTPGVFSGFIVTATVTRVGFGYTSTPAVTVSDATGGGASLTAVVSNGGVVRFVVNAAGTNYSAGATLTVEPPGSNARQTFSTMNFFTGMNTMTNPANRFAGDGSGLTNAYSVRGIFVNAAGNSFVFDPTFNSIASDATYSTIGGGYSNSAQTSAYLSFLGGGQQNSLQTNADHSFLGCGWQNSIQSRFSFLGGGQGNSIQTSTSYSFLGGGYGNSIQTNSSYSFLGGGYGNSIQTNSSYSFLGCGGQNSIQAGAPYSFLGGGSGNGIQTNAYWSFLGGGSGNSIQMYAIASFLGGGWHNSIETNAHYSFLGGGSGNSVIGNRGVIPGGYENAAGEDCFAAGSRALATNSGSFVWADNSSFSSFGTTASNQFLIRASGGVGINNNNPSCDLDVAGRIRSRESADGTAGLLLYQTGPAANRGFVGMDGDGYVGFYGFSGSGWGFVMNVTNGNVGIGTTTPTNRLHVVGTVQATAYITGSDRNAKENIAPVSADEILAKVSALPIATWNFRNDTSGTHLGPMAQDFRAAFNLGNTDSGIFTVDADGVALAAIQALAADGREQRSGFRVQQERIKSLETENEALKQQLDDVLQRLRVLEEKRANVE